MSIGTAPRSQLVKPRPIPENDPPPFPVRRFSVEEYHQLIEAGILQDGDPFELLDGWITPKMTKNPPHEVCLRLLHSILGTQIPTGWMYDSQLAITLSTSEPEPDGMIVKGSPRDYVSRHPRPRDLALVIEVAETSLSIDRKKAELYARDGIPRYWLINLVDGVLEDHSGLVKKAGLSKYRTVVSKSPEETVSIRIGKLDLSLLIKDVLP